MTTSTTPKQLANTIDQFCSTRPSPAIQLSGILFREVFHPITQISLKPTQIYCDRPVQAGRLYRPNNLGQHVHPIFIVDLVIYLISPFLEGRQGLIRLLSIIPSR